MRNNLRMAALACAFAAGVSTFGCVSGPPSSVSVRLAPPRARVEVLSVRPGPGHIWVAGYHRWNGNDYEWVPGRWETRPDGRSNWVSGKWKRYRGQWYWVEGHWR